MGVESTIFWLGLLSDLSLWRAHEVDQYTGQHVQHANNLQGSVVLAKRVHMHAHEPGRESPKREREGEPRAAYCTNVCSPEKAGPDHLLHGDHAAPA